MYYPIQKRSERVGTQFYTATLEELEEIKVFSCLLAYGSFRQKIIRAAYQCVWWLAFLNKKYLANGIYVIIS